MKSLEPEMAHMSSDARTQPFVVACIPALNEERSIGKVVLQTRKYVDHVIVCDDCSDDYSGEIASGLGATVIRHKKKLGKGAALRTAFGNARSLNPDIVVTLDADGQHNPIEIEKIVEPIIEGKSDIVIGSRFLETSASDPPFYRLIGLKILNFMSAIQIGKGVIDTQSGFRAFSNKALDVMLNCEVDGFGTESEQLVLASKHGLRVVEVPVSIKYNNIDNTSKKNPVRHGLDVIGAILKLIIEERPLLLLGVPGFIIILNGIFFGVYFLLWFNNTRYFSLPMAIISMGSLIMGSLLIITSLILHTLIRLKQSLNSKLKNNY